MMRKIVFAAASATAILFTSAVSAKTFIHCSEGSPEGFDPAPYASGTTLDASSKAVYNRLVEFEKGTTNVVPALAERWEVSEDGLEYTFYLRKGVEFQKTAFFTPTRHFNADDVLFSFNRQRLKDDPWYDYAPGISWEYFNSMDMPNLIKDIVKIDDHTVKFILTRPEAPFIANIAMDFASILSKEYADKLSAANKKVNLNLAPVGTGPFSFIAYQKDAIIRYAAHPNYWRGKQPIDTLVFAITTDSAVRMQKLKVGECHTAPYPSPADLADLQADPNLHVEKLAGLNIVYLGFNTQMAPFDRVEVRKALSQAVNKQAIIDAVFQGSGEAAKNPIPPTMWGYNDKVKAEIYDPEAAKKALEQAGIKNLKMKIWAMPVSRPYMPNARRTAELIQADFAKIGVEVEVVSMEWGEYLKKSSEIDRDGAIIMGWTGDNGDPDNFLGTLLSCAGVGANNRAQWCYKPFDSLIQRAKVIPNQAERAKLYEEAQAIFNEQAPWVNLAHSTVYLPLSKKVIGYKMDPLGSHRFDEVDLTD